MAKELCTVGAPSRLGGADTELEYQIILWRKAGIDVYICPTFDPDANALKMKAAMESIGCKYLPPRSWKDLTGFNVVSFCNRPFLDNLPEIKKYARTATFANCMTWNFEREIEMQKTGLIDFHLYQTDHQLEKVSVKLKASGPRYRPIRFRPYFHRDAFPFAERGPQEFFRFGRISRADGDKYGRRQIWIWETMTAPVLKRGLVLGWDQRSEKKLGRLPPYIKGHPAGGITQQDFYMQCDVIVMTTDTFENLPRVGFEAMSSGTLLVVDDRGGWKTIVEDGKTGWLCKDDREFVYKASRSAFELEESNVMRREARGKLEREWGEDRSMGDWERVFKEWDSI